MPPVPRVSAVIPTFRRRGPTVRAVRTGERPLVEQFLSRAAEPAADDRRAPLALGRVG